MTATARRTAVHPEDDAAPRPDVAGSLAGHTARGVAWVAGGRLASQVLQFASTIVLARLLIPSDYGLNAIVWSFTTFAFLLGDLGLGAALVQSKRMTQREASTAFWINAGSGALLTLGVLALSEPLAQLFGQPRVAPLLRLAALSYVLSLTVVPTAILERRMRFRQVALIDITSLVLGLVVSVVCAASGVGASSLVLGPLSTTLSASALSLLSARWLPRFRPTRAAARRLVGFGGHLAGYNLGNYWARNADNLLLGRVASADQLGLYSRAYMLMIMPVSQAGGVLGRVLLPVLSHLQDDHERLTRAVLRVCRASSLMAFPILFGMAATAPNFVRVAFGERWADMAPLLILLALSGAPQVAGILGGLASQAVGKPSIMSRWGNLNSALTVAAILLGLRWGATGVAAALAIRAYLLLPVSLTPLRKAIGVRTIDVLRANRLPFAAAAIMALAVVLVGIALARVTDHRSIVLAAQVVTGVASYVGVVALADPRALRDLLDLLRRRPLSV